jgi:hypothetical protein
MAVLGLEPRQFLELLRAHREIPRVEHGRLRLVRLEDLERALERLSVVGQQADTPPASGAGAPESADQVLAELGLRRVGGRR